VEEPHGRAVARSTSSGRLALPAPQSFSPTLLTQLAGSWSTRDRRRSARCNPAGGGRVPPSSANLGPTAPDTPAFGLRLVMGMVPRPGATRSASPATNLVPILVASMRPGANRHRVPPAWPSSSGPALRLSPTTWRKARPDFMDGLISPILRSATMGRLVVAQLRGSGVVPKRPVLWAGVRSFALSATPRRLNRRVSGLPVPLPVGAHETAGPFAMVATATPR